MVEMLAFPPESLYSVSPTPRHLASRSERQVGAFESRFEHLIGSRRESYDFLGLEHCHRPK